MRTCRSEMKSFFYSSYRKNAVIAGAMFSKIVLVIVAFMRGLLTSAEIFVHLTSKIPSPFSCSTSWFLQLAPQLRTYSHG